MKHLKGYFFAALVAMTSCAFAQHPLKESIQNFRNLLQQQFDRSGKYATMPGIDQQAEFDNALKGIAKADVGRLPLIGLDKTLRDMSVDFVARRDEYARFYKDYVLTVGNPQKIILEPGRSGPDDLLPRQSPIWQYLFLRPFDGVPLAHAHEQIADALLRCNGPGTVAILSEALRICTSSNRPVDHYCDTEVGLLHYLRHITSIESLNAICEGAANMDAQWRSQNFGKKEAQIDLIPYVTKLVRPTKPTFAARWQKIIDQDSGEGLSAGGKALLAHIKHSG